jgi:hypothetical protein
MSLTIASKPFYDGTQTPRFAVLNAEGKCVATVRETHGRAFRVMLGTEDFDIVKALRVAGHAGHVGAWRTMEAARADLAALSL